MTASLAFDSCLKQFLAPLVRGDAVWMLPMATVASPREMWSALGSRDRVGINCVPSLWSAMLAAVESGEVAAALSLRLLVLGGERPSEGLLARTWRLFPEIEVINVYGPTEATSNATWAKLRPNERITAGRPIWNTRVYVLDADGGLAPTGVVGEVWLGGKNLARGYLNRPELTAENFIGDTMTNEPGARLYRTGDRGRIDAEGRLELVGRTDEQVKLRGFRIELGEIRTALTNLPAIEDAAVVVRGEGDQRRLLAYVVPRPDTTPDAASLVAALRERLPDYMIPSTFVRLSALPRMNNGKVDVRSLPDSTVAHLPVGAPYEAPRTEVERMIAEVWRDVLGVDRVGVHDGFFELGGHSLLMLQVQSKLRVRFGRDIRIVELFKNPTIDSLARCLTDVPLAAPLLDGERARTLGRGRSALSSLRARAAKRD
jgi:acyl-CoA synthetase (AMP-forming)/AMP-acid ligase II